MDTKWKQLLLFSPEPEFTTGIVKWRIALLLSALCTCSFAQTKYQIATETLLKGVTSRDEMSRYPALPYHDIQRSSYNRRSVSPSHPDWSINDDGEGFTHLEERNGRKGRVLSEDRGPGTITRMRLATFDSINTVLRFYFDGKDEPGQEMPSYDLQKFGMRGLRRGLIEPNNKQNRGSLVYLSVPCNNGCKVTTEELTPERTNRHLLLNYRKYPTGTPVEIFSQEVAGRIPALTEKASDTLYKNIDRGSDPQSDYGKGSLNRQRSFSLNRGEKQRLNLRIEERAINFPQFNVKTDKNPKSGANDFALLMRSLIATISFDGEQTVWAPLSDFTGSGMGSFTSRSFLFRSDGREVACSKWLMPCRQNCEAMILNFFPYGVDIQTDIASQPCEWDNRPLYFHTAQKREHGLPIVTWTEHEKCMDWNLTTISDRGVYQGDLLSLFSHTMEWYGEGDEKITVDHESFPLHSGISIEDYYSFNDHFKSQTPFARQPRQDMRNLYGYNSFFRVGCLDAISFNRQSKFDFELLGRESGAVDYSSAVFWYGDLGSGVTDSSGTEEIEVGLLLTPT